MVVILRIKWMKSLNMLMLRDINFLLLLYQAYQQKIFVEICLFFFVCFYISSSILNSIIFKYLNENKKIIKIKERL